MIRHWLAGFYFYADDTLSSPGLSVLLALDFLAVFSELDQLFTRHRVQQTKSAVSQRGPITKARCARSQTGLHERLDFIAPAHFSTRPERPLHHLSQLLTEGHNEGRLAILSKPSFLFIASCLEQITAPRRLGSPQGAFSAVQVLWPGRHTGGPGHAGEEGTVAAFVSGYKGLQVLTAMINHPEADI